NHGREFRVPLPRAAVLDQVAAALSPAGTNPFAGSVGNFAKDLGGSASRPERKYLGMQARAENRPYFVLPPPHPPNTPPFAVGIVVAVSEVRGRMLEIGVFADMAGGATIAQLVAKAKEATARLVAANPEEPVNQI